VRLIIDDNVHAHVESPGGLGAALHNTLRFHPPGYNFVDSYKKGYWDGYISLLDKDGSFPTGLVDHVLDSFPYGRKLIEVEDRRVRPSKTMLFPKAKPNALIMHQVQVEAAAAAVKTGRGIINYPTGTGKGRIMGSIAAELCVPTLIVVDKTDLLRQLAAEVEPFIGESVGIIGGGANRPNMCTIATIQSLMSMFKRNAAGLAKMLNQFKLVIIDEVHHAESESYQTLLENMPVAYYRFGFSGTPFRSYAGKSDGLMTYLKVQAILGPPIATLSISEAVDTGRVVSPDIYVVHLEDTPLSKPLDPSWNYRQMYEWFIVKHPRRNALALAMAQNLPGKTITLVESIDHGNWFQSHGVDFIQGSTPKDMREAKYDRFRNTNIINSLVLSKLANEALDLPNINNLIIAGGGQAPHIKIQQIGRAMRSSGGKISANVFDFFDDVKYLDKHSRERRKLYDSEPAYNVMDIDEEDIWDLLRTS
jgi:superfamily II DNA or RNA helicase